MCTAVSTDLTERPRMAIRAGYAAFDCRALCAGAALLRDPRARGPVLEARPAGEQAPADAVADHARDRAFGPARPGRLAPAPADHAGDHHARVAAGGDSVVAAVGHGG